ncbi:MAG: hypothetical protein C4525_02975 [Desulfarculus sp.]|nr:MAG: hypothetical protein C4525_02975 [Desulfarculus sp.]
MTSSTEIAELLNEILITHAQGEKVVHRVAVAAGVSERTIYDTTSGRLNASVEVIKAAFLVVQDPRLRKLLEPEGWRLAPADQVPPPASDLASETADVILAASDSLKEARRAMADGRVSRPEDAALRRALERVRRETDEVEALLDRARGAGGSLRPAVGED